MKKFNIDRIMEITEVVKTLLDEVDFTSHEEVDTALALTMSYFADNIMIAETKDIDTKKLKAMFNILIDRIDSIEENYNK